MPLDIAQPSGGTQPCRGRTRLRDFASATVRRMTAQAGASTAPIHEHEDIRK